MDEFVAYSKSSQDALKMAMLSAELPVNIVLVGEKAVGKNHLAKLISPNAQLFSAVELEELIQKNSFEFELVSEVVVTDLQKITSTKSLLDRFDSKNIKVVATSTTQKDVFDELFQVKINVPPLRDRPEDVEFLTKKYISEAKKLFLLEDELPSVDIDLSTNAISLKKSIFRSLLFDSLTRENIMELLEDFFKKEFTFTTSYKELLEVFERPLLQAGKSAFGSQLKMAKMFEINRNTLRKKLSEYGLG